MSETAELADWQKGFSIDKLKEMAAPFKARHKALVFGAFGLTKERDIADAMSKQRAVWTGDPVQAVALFVPTKAASEQSDFAQREFVIAPGSVAIKAFAANSFGDGVKILEAIILRAEGAKIWLEIFEEDEIAKKCAIAARFVYVTTKVSAGSEIKGVYLHGAPSPLAPFSKVDEATLLVLNGSFLSGPMHTAIKAELRAFESLWAQHYSDYNKRKSWEAFALRGYSNDPGFIIKPAEMSKGWKEENSARLSSKSDWTDAAQHFPATVRAVGLLGATQFDRVRFMRLRSKNGELSRHADITDREAGTADGMVTRLHIPITTSDAVTFYGWNARGEKLETHWPERALCYLDQRKPHAVINSDPELNRIHLVVDCIANENIRELISRAA
jgi:Aspartyl/Asparaginyl beta-hydroxylase